MEGTYVCSKIYNKSYDKSLYWNYPLGSDYFKAIL